MPPGAFARRSDPNTSHLAADSINVNAVEGEILAFMQRHPKRNFTTLEITRHLYGDFELWSSISPRMRRMEERRLVRLVGVRYAENSYHDQSRQQAWRLAREVADGAITWVVQERGYRRSRNERLESMRLKLDGAIKRYDKLGKQIEKLTKGVRLLEDQRGRNDWRG